MTGKKKPKASRGMAPTKRGMRKKELEQGGQFGDTLFIKRGDTAPVQFFHEPDDFLVFQQHAWEEDRKWFFVPCTGDECPLDDDEDEARARRGYQWAAQILDVKEKKSKVLSGGKDLGNRVFYRYERKPSTFVRRVFEITKFATKPITYDVAPGEDKPLDLSKFTPIDLDEWLDKQVKAYYGEEVPKASDLEDEDEDDDEDEAGWDEDDDDDDEDEASTDDDEDDEDEEAASADDDDDDEEEEPPSPKRKKAKAGAKKARKRSRK